MRPSTQQRTTGARCRAAGSGSDRGRWVRLALILGLLASACARPVDDWVHELAVGTAFERRLAALALGETEPSLAPSAVLQLVSARGDPDPGVRAAADESLQRLARREALGSDPAVYLLPCLAHPDAPLRAAAAVAIPQFLEASPSLTAALGESARVDPAGVVRLAALEALLTLDPEGADTTAALQSLRRDEDGLVRKRVKEVLAERASVSPPE